MRSCIRKFEENEYIVDETKIFVDIHVIDLLMLYDIMFFYIYDYLNCFPKLNIDKTRNLVEVSGPLKFKVGLKRHRYDKTG